jgi:hypothetical protein
MRYENWDILLFPVAGETKVPMKEFKVACHVVHDTGEHCKPVRTLIF